MHASRYQELADPAYARASSESDQPSAATGLDACEAAVSFFHEYARERPEIVALWAFGVGFILGWKMKPW
jgi:hypothetical protein